MLSRINIALATALVAVLSFMASPAAAQSTAATL